MLSSETKILYLEFVAGDAALATDVLNKSGIASQIKAVSTKNDFLSALNNFTPDIIISDDALPSFNAIDALAELEKMGLNIPLIVVTVPHHNTVQSVVTMIKQGAYDYLTKDNIDSLPAAIAAAIKKHKSAQILNYQLANSFASIDEVFFSRDMLKSELLQISAGCQSVYGFTTAEFLDDPTLYTKIYHPDDSYLLAEFSAKLQRGEQVKAKYRIIHKDGFIRWIESKITPVFNDQGVLVRIDGVSRNISEAKAAQEMLQLSERKYRQIVETAQEGIWIIDENLLTTFVNNKTCEMLGYSAEEMIGKHNYDFKDDTEKAKTLERIKGRVLGISETHESSFITKSGQEVFCIVTTNGLYSDDGRYMGTLAMLIDITQRKADEEALRQSRANLSAIIENTTDLVYSLDRNFKFIAYNQVFKNTMKQVYFFDVEPDSSPLDILEGFDKEAAKKWRGIYNKALNGETQQFVIEYPFQDSKVYLSYSINPIWESGKVIGLSCFSRDITRQKVDEAAIKKSAANLAAIIENTDADIYSLDTELRYIAFNKSFKHRLLQTYKLDVKPGDKILDFLKASDPKGASEWEEVYAAALSGHQAQFTKEFLVGNVPAFFDISINPIWENDEVIGLSCSARNITKLKMDEIALRKSEASLRTVFNNTNRVCILIDTDRRIVSFNNLAQQYANDELNRVIQVGAPILDCIEANRKAMVNDVLNRTQGGSVINYQISRESNGKTKWFEINWAGIKDTEYQDFGYILTIKDITESKQLEIEREKITADLLQRNKALEQFTYIISHNLRAPVANIIGLSSLMVDTENEITEIEEIISSICRSANNLDEVISDLNQVLQVNENMNENIESILLLKLVTDIKFSIRHLIEKEQVSIKCDFSKAEEILSLKSFLHSILYNLILNSIKYRNPGREPVIDISTRVLHGKVSIRYRDNGRGIDTAKYANDIFGLYKRFDTSVEGKGMGLFMVKMQVESLGGTISLRSKLHEGTEFMIEFPQAHLQHA